MESHPDRDDLDRVIELVRTASSRVLEIYHQPFDVAVKDDGSPLTEADLASHRILSARLPAVLPGVPVVSEEGIEDLTPPPSDRFWLVDPLDGTKEFVGRTDEFTVNVALVEDGVPRLGVVSAPALGLLYAGIPGLRVFRIKGSGDPEPIEARRIADKGLIVVGSRSHANAERMDEYLKGRALRAFIAVGSSLKFCRIAEGRADLYPRFGRTMEWDTAAGHAVLLAAGGQVDTLEGSPLRYGKPGLDNPHFVAHAPSAGLRK